MYSKRRRWISSETQSFRFLVPNSRGNSFQVLTPLAIDVSRVAAKSQTCVRWAQIRCSAWNTLVHSDSFWKIRVRLTGSLRPCL